ncbi:hypothetical protein BD779DRAFT_1481639 [Infundibulicybe gibba]|nr:hypothetical protein BD779DRAFT_1481639 [Infundibulicybe gibba]
MVPPKNDGFKNRQQRWYFNKAAKQAQDTPLFPSDAESITLAPADNYDMELEDGLAYSDLLASLAGEYTAPPETRNTITDTPQLDIVYNLRKDVLAWASRWDGYTLWPEKLWAGYHATANKSPSTKDEWLTMVFNHAAEGRKLLDLLKHMGGSIPTNSPWLVRELWRLQFEMTAILVQGICAIEIRVNVVSPDWFSVIPHESKDGRDGVGGNNNSDRAVEKDVGEIIGEGLWETMGGGEDESSGESEGSM